MALPRGRSTFLLTLLAAGASWFAGGVACGQTKQQKEGGELYARMCAVCHGPNGEGYKADQAPALRDPGYLATATDAFLKESIVNGRLGSTMSSWGQATGGPLTDPQVEAVVAYM